MVNKFSIELKANPHVSRRRWMSKVRQRGFNESSVEAIHSQTPKATTTRKHTTHTTRSRTLKPQFRGRQSQEEHELGRKCTRPRREESSSESAHLARHAQQTSPCLHRDRTCTKQRENKTSKTLALISLEPYGKEGPGPRQAGKIKSNGNASPEASPPAARWAAAATASVPVVVPARPLVPHGRRRPPGR